MAERTPPRVTDTTPIGPDVDGAVDRVDQHDRRAVGLYLVGFGV